MKRIAVIGAGLSGISFARAMAERADITIFEKSRGVGGRLATRYAGIFEFDHGAQYFKARTDAFQSALKPHLTAGQVVEWTDPIVKIDVEVDQSVQPVNSDTPFYVAVPRMNILPKAMAEGLDIKAQIQISTLHQEGPSWYLTDVEGQRYGPFDWVVSSAPAPQTQTLFPDTFSGQSVLKTTSMVGCFTLVLGFESRPSLDWSAARISGSPLGWIAVNSDKPGRDTSPSLVVQTTNDWAEAHLEDDPDDVRQTMLQALKDLTDIDMDGAQHSALHRWRYANTDKSAGQKFLIDTSLQLAACGDWCIDGKVEAAFLSGLALAEAIAA